MAVSGTGRALVMDDADGHTAAKAIELALLALGGCTAFDVTMNCSGMPSGLGLAGSSQASVQSLRSMRHGLPVHARLRTVSRVVAAR